MYTKSFKTEFANITLYKHESTHFTNIILVIAIFDILML